MKQRGNYDTTTSCLVAFAFGSDRDLRADLSNSRSPARLLVPELIEVGNNNRKFTLATAVQLQRERFHGSNEPERQRYCKLWTIIFGKGVTIELGQRRTGNVTALGCTHAG